MNLPENFAVTDERLYAVFKLAFADMRLRWPSLSVQEASSNTTLTLDDPAVGIQNTTKKWIMLTGA